MKNIVPSAGGTAALTDNSLGGTSGAKAPKST